MDTFLHAEAKSLRAMCMLWMACLSERRASLISAIFVLMASSLSKRIVRSSVSCNTVSEMIGVFFVIMDKALFCKIRGVVIGMDSKNLSYFVKFYFRMCDVFIF